MFTVNYEIYGCLRESFTILNEISKCLPLNVVSTGNTRRTESSRATNLHAPCWSVQLPWFPSSDSGVLVK